MAGESLSYFSGWYDHSEEIKSGDSKQVENKS